MNIYRTIVFVVASGAAAPASAQPSSAQKAQSVGTFREGQALLEKGDIAAACRAFDASYALAPSVGTLLNRADCRARNHQLATAWGLFLEAERGSRNATDEATQKNHQAALDHSQQLAGRASKLTISVAADVQVDGLEVLRDKDVVEPAVWNVALPIDGGTYTITARAPGTAAWTTTIAVGDEGDTKTIDLPKLRTLAPPPLPSEPALAPTADTNEATPGRTKKIVGLSLGGVSLVSIAAGIVAARTSAHGYAAIENAAHAGEPFDPAQQSTAQTAKAIAIGAFATAGATAVAGATLFFLGVREQRAVVVAPLVSPDVVGAIATVRF